MGMTYVETFDDGAGGWTSWSRGLTALETRPGSVVSRSPWWIDANHAPPGGGYLHLLFVLYTSEHRETPQSGVNRFVEDGFPTDFTNARMTLRLRGELETRGTKLVLLAQARVGDRALNHVLTAQPFEVTPDWTEQTITLVPDPDQWLCLGSRHDRMDTYGWGDIADVLRDLNADIILVLHPVDVAPAGPIDHDPHYLSAGKDYDADVSRLPSGYVEMDEVRIEFAD
jgi:hypothetical protein